ncbi:hypothetical protein SK128_013364 [Halocaridina rubra]|uniref:Uncharacterized protein n=1 Tax=Halocaridina rubra TaxID=373956 RepID=A0AAN9A7K4_HALRR
MEFSVTAENRLWRAVIAGEEVETAERVHDSTASAYSSRLHTEGTPPSSKGHRDDLPVTVYMSKEEEIGLENRRKRRREEKEVGETKEWPEEGRSTCQLLINKIKSGHIIPFGFP